MSYLEDGRLWVDYLNRVSRTITTFAIINQTCEDSVKLMLKINLGILGAINKKWGKRELPHHQVFVSIFYTRNIIYLQSSHALTCMGFIDPSLNLNRTAFESILKGYLFIVEHNEADEYYRAIEHAIDNKEDETYSISRGVSYLRKKLYTPAMSEKHKELYKLLCISAHSDIKGAAQDYPKYLPNSIRDNLNMALLLMYGSIQMMAESSISLTQLQKRTSKRLWKTLRLMSAAFHYWNLIENPTRRSSSSRKAIFWRFYNL